MANSLLKFHPHELTSPSLLCLTTSKYVFFESKKKDRQRKLDVSLLTFAFRRTWPRHGELFDEGGRFRAAALFTGIEHSVSLVSQLEMGEFSKVRCLRIGDY